MVERYAFFLVPCSSNGLSDNITGNDRAQILLRNALQILKIVKATFPNPAFDNPFAEVQCDAISSSAQELVCKWRAVTNVFQAAGHLRPKPEDVIAPLAEV